jgi:hypothetical protein
MEPGADTLIAVEARRSASMHKRLRVTAQKWQAKTESPERGTVESHDLESVGPTGLLERKPLSHWFLFPSRLVRQAAFLYTN